MVRWVNASCRFVETERSVEKSGGFSERLKFVSWPGPSEDQSPQATFTAPRMSLQSRPCCGFRQGEDGIPHLRCQRRPCVYDDGQILVDKSLPLDGTIRVMRALQEIPQDLWIQTVEVVDQKGQRVGKTRNKVVHVKGKGKEVTGPPIESIFTKFAGSLKKRTDLGEVKTPSTPGEHATIEFDFEFNLLALPTPDPKAGTALKGEGK